MSRSFVLDGHNYDYCMGRHNAAWRNERTIEVPIGLRFVHENGGRILEVGDVLSHYAPTNHIVVDLGVGKGEGPIRCDIVEFDAEPFDAILSISTMEHIWKENGAKFLRAFDNVKRLLKPGGTMLVTMPLAWQPGLDELLVAGRVEFTRCLRMARADKANNWVQVEWPGEFIPYGKFQPGAASDVFIGIYTKAPN